MRAQIKTSLCVIIAVFFALAGYLHFAKTDMFASIVPPLLPFPKAIVWVTGIIEIVLAIGIVLPKYRRLSGLLFAPYLLAVLPANIYMAMAGLLLGTDSFSAPLLWLRVALQFPLIALILWASGNLDRRSLER